MSAGAGGAGDGGGGGGGDEQRSVLKVILGSPRPVWILVAGVFVNRSGSYFATFLTLFLEQLGFTLAQMPLILLAVGVAIPCGSMLGGWVSDRFSRKASLVGSTLLAAVGLAVIGFAPTKAVALVGVFAAALFAQSYLPAASALLVDHTREQDRVPVFAFFRLALNVGAAVGPVLAIAITPYGLESLFLVSSGAYLLFSLVLWLGLPKPAARVAEEASADEVAAGGKRFPAQLVLFFTGVLLITAVYVQYSSTVPLAVADFHDAKVYAGLLTLNAVLVIVFEVPLSAWTRKLPWRLPLVLGTALMAVGIAASGSFPSFALLIASVVTWTIGEILFSPVVASAAASLSPSGRVGRYQGYLAAVQSTAFALGPAVGTYVYGRGAPLLWVSCLVAGLLAAVAFTAAHKPRGERGAGGEGGVGEGSERSSGAAV
ncbi:MFS transporter [Actinosynnema pretiosum subsp. pretiosum]|uniref:MFS transporter n=1 Tax=Actinosynnema pretiosum subsp. pretiosum TaxID=103721 RepID=A0AA45L655_9PSEU|nr:MFS transporter [Actinosynnema pretiosum subsp. pretiosum]